MKDYLLLRTQKNKIFECVQEAGLNPLNFEWVEENTECNEKIIYHVSIVRYLHTDFYFKFDRDQFEYFYCKSHPSTRDLTVMLSYHKLDWQTALFTFKEWLSRLKEQEVPDLWEQVKEYAPDVAFIGTAEIPNTPFSYSEAENIIETVDRARAQIERNFDLRPDQLTFIKREFEYLKEAAKSQGRKAWRHTFIGVIVTIVMGLALSPEKTKLLWDLLKSCFAGLLQLPTP